MGSSLRHYFKSRWRGHAPARTLFWWDLTVIGTLLNCVLGLISLILLAKDVDGGVWLALHFVLIPYNLFLVLSVHRTADSNLFHRSLSIAWFGCTLLI